MIHACKLKDHSCKCVQWDGQNREEVDEMIGGNKAVFDSNLPRLLIYRTGLPAIIAFTTDWIVVLGEATEKYDNAEFHALFDITDT